MNPTLLLATVLALPATLPLVRARAESPPPGLAQGAPVPTFERAVGLALTHDERARIADKTVASAEAQRARARSFFFPDVLLTGGWTYRPAPGSFQAEQVLTGTAGVTLTLFDGRGFPLHRAAVHARDAAVLDRADARRRIAFEVAEAYLTTLGVQAVVAAAEHRVEFARAATDDARARVSAGLVGSNDATRAELELATAERERTRATGDFAAARLNLGFLVGVPIDGPLPEPTALLGAPTPPAAALVREAQDRRLSLRAGRARLEAARASAEEPLWRWAPTVSVISQARWTTVEDVTGRQSDWFVGANASWALWDGGERTADRDDRVAQAEAAELGLIQDTRRVATEVATALVELDRARAAIVQAQLAQEAARKNVDETRTLYRQGLARSLELHDSTARLFDADVALARERFGLGLAVLALRTALGLDPLGAEVRS